MDGNNLPELKDTPAQPQHQAEDVAAAVFYMLAPRFRAMVDHMSKKKLLRFAEALVHMPETIESPVLTDEIKKMILEVRNESTSVFKKNMTKLGSNAIRRLLKMMIEFPLHDASYNIRNKFEDETFALANRLLQAKYTIFINDATYFEEVQGKLNQQIQDLEKESLLLANKLIYAKFIMILTTLQKYQEEQSKEQIENVEEKK